MTSVSLPFSVDTNNQMAYAYIHRRLNYVCRGENNFKSGWVYAVAELRGW